MTTNDGWYLVSSERLTFAMRIVNGLVITTAPVAQWATGKTADYVLNYYQNHRGFTVERMEDNVI
jgi:hypothetical protein